MKNDSTKNHRQANAKTSLRGEAPRKHGWKSKNNGQVKQQKNNVSTSIEKVIEMIQTHMEGDELIWHKPFLSAAQANVVSKNEYRGINHFVTALVAFKLGYQSPYWGTFRQIKELGGSLIDAKGKGVPIIFFKDLRNIEETESGKKRFVIQHSFVFNFDLVEDIDLTLSHPENLDFDQDKQSEIIINDYLEREAVRLATGNPSYAPTTDVVRMLPKEQFISQDEYYSAFFHELAHSTGHNKRLARFETEQVRYESKEDYSKEELVAEITAALICHVCGVDSQASIKNSAAYLQGWSSFIKESGSAFITAVGQAYKAKDLILDQVF
ncbi:MAG: hypothetical protein COA71_00400 [SAR86 cluster bacterium]|uniref:DUF1738 domain-containing protein n=1 Tax=SAR86 cluster bacterium TaxID=2030880 RepID=A0A2A5CIL9_9GAMM|nr:MAG: hypothetical protein COA71_00400 [SAR86 cluster bacterium]